MKYLQEKKIICHKCVERVALREQYNGVATGEKKVEMREETDKWGGASKAGRCSMKSEGGEKLYEKGR